MIHASKKYYRRLCLYARELDSMVMGPRRLKDPFVIRWKVRGQYAICMVSIFFVLIG